MSNLIGDLESALLARLNATAYQTDAGVDVDGLTAVQQSSREVLRDLEDQLNGLGLQCLLLTPDLQPRDANILRAVIGVRIMEDVQRNRDVSGMGILGHELGLQCWARLEDWAPAEIWTAIRMQPDGLSQVEATENTITWLLTGYTETRRVVN